MDDGFDEFTVRGSLAKYPKYNAFQKFCNKFVRKIRLIEENPIEYSRKPKYDRNEPMNQMGSSLTEDCQDISELSKRKFVDDKKDFE